MKDGGPAFPDIRISYGTGIAGSDERVYLRGMSLRDYFIAHAPADEIKDISPDTVAGCAKFLGMGLGDYKGPVHYVLVLAKARCIWADAMLAEREKR